MLKKIRDFLTRQPTENPTIATITETMQAPSTLVCQGGELIESVAVCSNEAKRLLRASIEGAEPISFDVCDSCHSILFDSEKMTIEEFETVVDAVKKTGSRERFADSQRRRSRSI